MAPKGTRPRAIQQQQYEFVYLFGAVCINTGKTEALITPFSNMLIMEEHIKLISKATPKNKHAVVLMERASWHQSHVSKKWDNLTISTSPHTYQN